MANICFIVLYFVDGTMNRPLYFQHNGHSRTIVGIQVKKGTQGMPDVYNLLVLDPSQARLYYCILII